MDLIRATSLFSNREKEVLLLLLFEGLTNKEISEKLYISTRTVDSHMTNMQRKTNTKNKINLIAWVIKNIDELTITREKLNFCLSQKEEVVFTLKNWEIIVKRTVSRKYKYRFCAESKEEAVEKAEKIAQSKSLKCFETEHFLDISVEEIAETKTS
ncbi:MAG: response regulator transcription factor [Waterburya sp.]